MENEGVDDLVGQIKFFVNEDSDEQRIWACAKCLNNSEPEP
jgi:hypothetical protein